MVVVKFVLEPLQIVAVPAKTAAVGALGATKFAVAAALGQLVEVKVAMMLV
jgi:hypothetical protein